MHAPGQLACPGGGDGRTGRAGDQAERSGDSEDVPARYVSHGTAALENFPDHRREAPLVSSIRG